ncbi:MAG: polymorphic toxin type 23 domain-containing protein [Brumimicrobium sp.]|nr:polymorphic toxin type 23 domain-containing protein [Brumimicrobium sp.]
MTRIILSFLIFIAASKGNSQLLQEDEYGIQVGLSANFGTHINQVGIKIQGYYRYEFVQLNAGNYFLINSKNLADRRNFIENRINIGTVLLAGRRESIPSFILDGLNHQSAYDYGLAYNYLIYLDNAGSGQVSGGFGFHIKQISILIENDLFSGTGRDRFRTSYTQINYHDELMNLSFNTQLWTGETWGTELKTSDTIRYPVGYKDLRNTLYGRKSHGIVSVGIDYYLFYGNYLSALIGLDSERIRNGLQNKLMHNKPFVPKTWRKPNVSYPMLSEEGYPVDDFDLARKNIFYLQFGLNRPMTY